MGASGSRDMAEEGIGEAKEGSTEVLGKDTGGGEAMFSGSIDILGGDTRVGDAALSDPMDTDDVDMGVGDGGSTEIAGWSTDLGDAVGDASDMVGPLGEGVWLGEDMTMGDSRMSCTGEALKVSRVGAGTIGPGDTWASLSAADATKPLAVSLLTAIRGGPDACRSPGSGISPIEGCRNGDGDSSAMDMGMGLPMAAGGS